MKSFSNYHFVNKINLLFWEQEYGLNSGEEYNPVAK